MHKVDYPVQSPGLCLICEANPPGDYVDTLRDYVDQTLVHRLSGRKYVCSNCVQELATVMDYIMPHDYAILREEYGKLQQDYGNLVEAYSDVQEAISKDFFGMVEKMTTKASKPKTKPKGGK